MFVGCYAVKMRGGNLRFQALYLRRIRVPRHDMVPTRTSRELARAFEARDLERATVGSRRCARRRTCGSDRVQEPSGTVVWEQLQQSQEAIGNAIDIWTAYREGLFGTVRPWLGYLFLLEEAPGSIKPVRVKQPFFEVDPVFIDASYKDRYEILCRRLVLERLYDAACLVTASADPLSPIHEPAPDLNFTAFSKAIRARAVGLLSGE